MWQIPEDVSLNIDHINSMSKLGVALKRIRKKLDVSQKQLADHFHIRQATISDIENGKGTLDSFFKIIQALRINLTLSIGQPEKQKNRPDAFSIIDIIEE